MGASVRPDPVQEYLTSKGGSDPVSDYLSAKQVVPRGASGTWGDEPSAGVGAHFMNAMQGIPGGERFEAAVGQAGSHLFPSLYGGKPVDYQTSLNAVRSLTAPIGPNVSAAEKFLGSLLTLRALPANPTAAGAVFGGADQALSADQKPLQDRAVSTAVGTGAGALLGNVLDKLVTLGRSWASPAAGAQAVANSASRGLADAANYGAAETEGNASTKDLTHVLLGDPTVAPYAKLAMNAERNAGANDAKLARETYKLMSSEEGGLTQRLKDNGYDAALAVQRDNITVAKARLKAAAGASDVMPSFPSAVSEHARMMGEQDAFQQGYDAAKTSFNGTKLAGRKLAAKSTEAFAERAKDFTPAEAQAAVDGILARMKEYNALARTPIVHIPLPFPSTAVQRAPGLIRAAGGATPQPFTNLLMLNARQGFP